MNLREARCRSSWVDPEWFFAPPTWQAIEWAKAICSGCPLKEPCREAGKSERYGIWGGTDEKERLEWKRRS